MIAPTVESTPEELAVQRHQLDLALQPLDSFKGFDHLEQFGSSAYRYQLNFITYSLCMAQFTRTPAFTGYLVEAQRNAIVKMTDKRVWAYWAKENLIGYGGLDPDPMVRRNVMYTGFFGAMIGLYETLNADRSLSVPGALTLVWNKRKSFPYDFARICEAIERNMREKPGQPQYPCEPRLVYPMCNAYAINSLVMHDRLHGTAHTGDLVDQLRTSYRRDGWLRKDGRWIGGGTRSGRKIFPPYLGNDASMVYWLTATMPDVSEYCWNIVRDKHVLLDDAGELDFKSGPTEMIDFGNYGMLKGDVFTRTALMAAAREMGDLEAAAAIDRSLQRRHALVEKDGRRKFKGVSNWANGFHALALFTRPGAARDLVLGNVPAEWKTGPILADAAYPAVLVAKAVSDGRALDLVLRPGAEPGRVKLAVARLVPGTDYRVTGAVSEVVTAGADGKAIFDVDLDGRTEVRLVPVVGGQVEAAEAALAHHVAASG